MSSLSPGYTFCLRDVCSANPTNGAHGDMLQESRSLIYVRPLRDEHLQTFRHLPSEVTWVVGN